MKQFLFISFILFFSCNEKNVIATPDQTKSAIAKVDQPVKQPKNIILMIGDGMGLTQITAGLYSNNNKLNLERIKTIGLHKSYAIDNLVTDSAAGATAFSAGVKTYNGAIGVDADTNLVETILEEAEAKGLATGLVASSTIVHATPASFFSHNKSRKNYEAIAADLVRTEVDYWVGGGKQFFQNRTKDERNISNELIGKRNYVIKDFINDEIATIELPLGKNIGFLTANKDPLPVSQGRDYLEAASIRGVEFLKAKNDKGFFMMIEGSQIDWGGHANKIDYVVSELLEFDRVIGKILDFVEKDGETLLVITADHETGGLAINPESTMGMGNIKAAFTTDYHTAAMIPVFAYGPGAENFAGIYENTAIYNKMRKAIGWD